MESIQSNAAFIHITETCLKEVLEYTGADHIFVIRASSNDMILDASISKERSWSLLEDVLLTSNDIAERFEGVDEARWTMNPVSIPCSLYEKKSSILCIPIILQDKYLGCTYLIHHTLEYAFEHVKNSLLTLLLTNYFHLLISNSFKRRVVKEHKESLSLPCLKDIINVKQQDSLHFYDVTTKKWNVRFFVLAESKIWIFYSPFDLHAHKVIILSKLRDIKVTSNPNAKNPEFSPTPTPKKSSSSSSDIKLPILPKNKSMTNFSLIFLHLPENEQIWIACERLETAHDWHTCILEEKRKGKSSIKIPTNIRINVDDVNIENIVGKGSAAVVYEGTFQRTKVAVKQLLDQFDKSETKSFFDEMNILQQLHHPNVVNLFGGFISKEGKPSIVFEFALRGSLASVLYDPLTEITNAMKIQFLLQTIKALQYLHSFNPPIIHRDVKPANILVCKTIFTFFS